MPDPIYGLQRAPGSLAQLSRFTRGWNSQQALFLLPLCFQDYFFKFYEFADDVISTDWTVNEATGASTVFAKSNSVEYGALVGATTTVDNTTISINYDGVFFDANRNPGLLCRMKASAITDLYIEVSWMDAPTQPYTINWALDTPTLQSNGTTDVASVVIDTDATQKTAALCVVGTTDSTPQKVNLSQHGRGRNGSDAYAETNYDVPGTIPIAADTYFTVLLQLTAPAAHSSTPPLSGVPDGSVTATINGNPLLSGTSSKGLDTGVKLRPQINVGNRSTAAKTFTLDYVALWCNRQ